MMKTTEMFFPLFPIPYSLFPIPYSLLYPNKINENIFYSTNNKIFDFDDIRANYDYSFFFEGRF